MWKEIIRGIAARSPELAATLEPPASAADIDALEARVGAPLPDAFKQYLGVMDGQNDGGETHSILDHERFLPVGRIVELMDMMDSLFGDEGRVEHIAENRIQPVLWDARWIPFTAFDGSARLILDLHPGRNGAHGQVFLWFPGVDLADEETVVASSFEDFSARLLARLTNREAG